MAAAPFLGYLLPFGFYAVWAGGGVLALAGSTIAGVLAAKPSERPVSAIAFFGWTLLTYPAACYFGANALAISF